MVAKLDRLLARACRIMLAAGIAFGAFPAAAADKVSLRLDWVNSGYHAIWYYGIDTGLFTRAGIDLEVLEGKGSAVTAQTVGNGSVMFGTADTVAVMGLVSQGLPIKVVGGYLRQSPLAIIFPTSKGWQKFSDMAGAKIGFSAGGASSQLLPPLLKSAGLEGKIELINMEPAAKMTSLLTGRVDAIESFDFLMVSILEGKGLKVSTIPYASAGVNVPGLSLVAADDMIRKEPALVGKMVAAMEQTLAASRKNPESAIDSLMKRSPTLDRAVVLRTLQLSFNLVEPDWAKGKPLAWMSPDVMAKSQDVLFEYGGIKKKLPIEDYFTNQFVPAS
jgi:NitT/TauT family transport system substrate-binding protein